MLTHPKNSNLSLNYNKDGYLAHRHKSKIFDLIQHLYTEYNDKAKIENLPFLASLCVHQSSKEGFSLYYQQKKFELTADSPLGAVYGLTQLNAAVRSQYLAEYVGESQPRYPLRPLWLCADRLSPFTAEIGIALPSFLLFTDGPSLEAHPLFERLCHQILEYGFNAVILGSRRIEEWIATQPQVSIKQLCQAFQSFGLKVILKPSFHFLDPFVQNSFKICPFDPHYRSSLLAMLEPLREVPFDGLVWETTYHHPQFAQHPAADEATLVEILAEEIKLIESFLESKRFLLYFLSCADQVAAQRHASWFPFLCNQAGMQTYLVFPSVAGDPCADYLPPHPIWNMIRSSPDLSSTPLLPLVNGGAIQQGEGLWPSLSLDLIDQILNRCSPHRFVGAITLTQGLPTNQGLLSCNLWLIGQALWRAIPCELLAETWFKTYRPDLSFLTFKKWLRNIREIVIELGFLRTLTNEKSRDILTSEDCRAKAESLLAQLHDLQLTISKEKSSTERLQSTFADYFLYFYRDARRSILHFLQCHNIPLANLLTGGDMQPSFWTQAISGSGQGIRSGLKVIFYDKPLLGEKDSLMERIYLENHLS